MNKKLMAVAVAGVFAAPALVLAQSSTVQIYGKVTYDYAYIDQDQPGRASTDVAQGPHGSNIGFRGSEKLGGGLTAWFQCESSADVRGGLSGNQNGFCTRNSAIGFKGAWGNLHFGRWDSPIKRSINQGNVGALDTGFSGHSNIFSGGSGGTNPISANGRQRWKRRDAAWTYYESPTFSGFQVLGGITAGNAATSDFGGAGSANAKPRVLSIGGIFKNGPFAVGLGYEEHKEFGTSAFQDQDDSAWAISGSYTFMNKIKVGAIYLDAEYETGALVAGAPQTKVEKKNWQIGVDWKIAGPHALEAAYTEAGDTKGNGTQSIGVGSGGDIIANTPGSATGGDMFSIGYRYSFSKRTNLRIKYAQLNNDTNANYALSGISNNTVAGNDMSAFGIVLQHSF
jgi:predicted porin